MTETHDPDPIDLEHRLDQQLAKYLDHTLRPRSGILDAADRGDLASDLADAARQHFTGSAADTPSPLGLLGVLARLQDAADHADYLMGPTVTSGPAATRVNSLRQSLYQAIAMLEAAREAPVNVQAEEPMPVDGFRLRDVLALIDWVGDRGHLTGEGDPSTDGFRRLRAVRSGFIDRDPGEAPDVGLVALRPGERIVSTYAPAAPAGLARKVGRLLDDAAAPDGWIIVRPGHDFEALVERIVDTVREAMPVPELPPARALNPESPVFCLTEALLALDTAASARTAGAATGLLQTARQRILDGIRALPDGAPEATTDDDPRADPPLWATANAAMVELFRAVRCCPVEDLARLDQSKVLDARRAVEWVENMPPVLWPASTFEEEPF